MKHKKNKTHILLIGVSKYSDDKDINSIPNVRKNISRLTDTFLKNKVLNIEEENLTISLNETKTEIERKLINVSRKAENQDFSLIVYYAGHGILSNEDFNLYFAALNTTINYLETDGVNANRFREIIENSKAGTKIIITDACFSGAIHGSSCSSLPQIRSESNKYTGTYILTSSSEVDTSRYPPEKPYLPTYFTGEFLKILKNGIKNNNPYITIRDIYDELERSFRESDDDIPLLQQSSFQNADKFIFASNNFYNKTTENIESDNTEPVFVPYAFSEINKKPKRKFITFFKKSWLKFKFELLKIFQGIFFQYF